MYHDLVFEAAECVFGEKGFERTTMQDIASEAGVSLRTVHTAFEGKQERYEEIMKVRATAFIGHVRNEMDAVEHPMGRVAAATRAYVEFLFEHRDWLRIHLAQSAGPDLPTPRAGVGSRAVAGHRRLRGDTEGRHASGVFIEDDPEDLALTVQGVLQTRVSRVRRLICKPERA